MTPRESLEAAGWTPANNYAIWWHVNSNGWITQAEALAQLARDKAKETSDGNVGKSSEHRNGSDNRGGDSSDRMHTTGAQTMNSEEIGKMLIGQAPVATSVFAPDDLGPRLLATHNWMQAHEVVWEGYFFRVDGRRNCSLSFLLAEYASSSSAALLAANEVIRRQLKKVCDQAEAAEARVAALRGQLEVRETLAAADLEKLKELEDNSAQDEREIEALQESLRTVRQDLADRDGIIIGLQDVAAGKTRPLTDIEAELRGNKS